MRGPIWIVLQLLHKRLLWSNGFSAVSAALGGSERPLRIAVFWSCGELCAHRRRSQLPRIDVDLAWRLGRTCPHRSIPSQEDDPWRNKVSLKQ